MESRYGHGSETVCRMEISPEQRAARDRIAAELAATGLALPRHTHPARLPLRQAQLPLPTDPAAAHGPYARVDPQDRRLTVTRRLTAQQLAAWQPLLTTRRSSGHCSPNSKNSPSGSSRPAESLGNHKPANPDKTMWVPLA